VRCSRLVVTVLAVLGACDRPTALVVCHNANCVEPADPLKDDTLDALRASLAIEHEGRPAIDGLELDTFWRGADGACLYAHDIADNNENTPASAPAMEVATYLAGSGPVTFGNAPFQVLIELKSHVSVDTQDRHTPEQRQLHARCAWDLYRIISTAAVANDRAVEIELQAFAPELIQALIDNQPTAADAPTPFRYGAIQGVPTPLDDQTRPLGDYGSLPISIVEFHNQWILDAQYEQILDRDPPVDVALFMFSATVETYAAIEQYEPSYIVTNEARTFRRWLAY
jgi:hypothetical protein